jgi:ribosomal protein S18 acetylase RimI-like enzyme
MNSDTENGLLLRSGTVGDADAAAALHAGQISEGFLSILGPAFLTKLYCRVVRTPGSFLLIVQDGTEIAGFLAGSSDVSGLYRSFLLRDGAVAALTCAGRLLRSWRRVMETLRHGAIGAAGGAELLAVAVHPALRGRGAGALLVGGFLSELEQRGQDSAHVVVAADNEIAITLYKHAGFGVAETFELHEGTESLLMCWPAPKATPSP